MSSIPGFPSLSAVTVNRGPVSGTLNPNTTTTYCLFAVLWVSFISVHPNLLRSLLVQVDVCLYVVEESGKVGLRRSAGKYPLEPPQPGRGQLNNSNIPTAGTIELIDNDTLLVLSQCTINIATFMTNGLSHPYYLDESTDIFRGIRDIFFIFR